MAEGKAYKLKADASFPKAIRETETLVGGEKIWETEGRSYAEGDYVLASDLTPRDQERAENGELDHLLESVSVKEAEEALGGGPEYGTFIPEHEAERVALTEYGHQVVPHEQVLELTSAGADAAREAQEEAKKDGADERDLPQFDPQDAVPDEDLRGVEQSPGIPVGEDAVEAKGGEAKKSATRSRPRPAASEEKKSE